MIRMRSIVFVAIGLLSMVSTVSAQRIVVEPDEPRLPVPPPPQDAPTFDIAKLEDLVHAAVNAARDEHGLESLRHDNDLASISRMHSGDMARNGYFGHVSLSGATPSMRVARGGYLCHAARGGVAENLYAGYFYDSYRVLHSASGTQVFFDWKGLDEIAQEIVDGWLNSPPHRANLLDPAPGVHGIGIVRSKDNQFFATQNLC